jgi:hypothetical protein
VRLGAASAQVPCNHGPNWFSTTAPRRVGRLERAGIGHAANCELNYAPQRNDGSVDISKALEVNAEFDFSRQLWSFLDRNGAIPDPRTFIHPCPRMSFVWGDANVAFLRERFSEMSVHHCYHGMQYSEDHNKTAEWAPLIIDGRDDTQPIAATRIVTGTDVDYGALTHLLANHLSAQPGSASTTTARSSALTGRTTDAGVSRSRIPMTAQSKPFRQSSCSSGRAAAHCRYRRSPRLRRARATADSP